MSTGFRKKIEMSLLTLLAAAGVISCGSSSPAPKSSSNPDQAATAPTNLPASGLSALSSAELNGLLGIYDATLFKKDLLGTWSNQKISITLSIESVTPTQNPQNPQNPQSPQGGAAQNYLKMTVDIPETTEAFQKVNFSTYLALDTSSSQGKQFNFISNSTRIKELYDFRFSIEAKFNLLVNPTQALMYFKDCGFSQAVTCDRYAQDVGIGSDLRKRP